MGPLDRPITIGGRLHQQSSNITHFLNFVTFLCSCESCSFSHREMFFIHFTKVATFSPLFVFFPGYARDPMVSAPQSCMETMRPANKVDHDLDQLLDFVNVHIQ